ncbi:hypothetical protein Tco_0006561 [Tanacetum coccineum]
MKDHRPLMLEQLHGSKRETLSDFRSTALKWVKDAKNITNDIAEIVHGNQEYNTTGNGNAPPITKVVEGVETTIAPTTAKEKAQRVLEESLKQQYENFTASSSEVLDQTFDRLQKLISQLEIHGESISQEDVNQKFLRSLSPE